jgi:adenylate kinase
MINIILLGDPASGKATQAEYLTKKHKLYDFDMGKELRKLRRKDSKLNASLQKTQDKGKLTPTKVVRAIHQEKILKTPKNTGILFDGHPKMIGEAKLVRKWMREVGRGDDSVLVLYIKIPHAEVVKRMLGRKEYHAGKYSKRADDNEKALRNRVKYYRDNISDVIKFFKQNYAYKQIDGLGTEKQVSERIEKAVHEFHKKPRRNK